jgi:hypothetical protein
MCLHDDVTGHLTHLGRTTGNFEVVFDVAAVGEDGCGPIGKQGTFIAASGGRLDVEAAGTFCFGTLVAHYEFQVTGSTRRFAGARGSGSWLVQTPTTFDGVSGTGDEFSLQRGGGRVDAPGRWLVGTKGEYPLRVPSLCPLPVTCAPEVSRRGANGRLARLSGRSMCEARRT